jgi:drug/metabolite transporter (DMT)-like permease
LAGLQRLSSSKASLVVMIEPVVAAIAAWVILDEKLSLAQAAGALLVLFSLFLNATKSK